MGGSEQTLARWEKARIRLFGEQPEKHRTRRRFHVKRTGKKLRLAVGKVGKPVVKLRIW